MLSCTATYLYGNINCCKVPYPLNAHIKKKKNTCGRDFIGTKNKKKMRSHKGAVYTYSTLQILLYKVI